MRPRHSRAWATLTLMSITDSVYAALQEEGYLPSVRGTAY